ncbi:addiction module antidote protein [Basilea psittacipulmonis]|uniref:Addiction module antitoxin n=1 Tax=Basilea psittacipulmonis DSM 24701 TaxID=1072685 RepID=A0A077DDV0_9BURK|nr:addiction module antidote protein [Basilea psittacipulmonis]AIL33045.1 addiction module antitoxin [Basilea psittacipulmonis DSM 24701]
MTTLHVYDSSVYLTDPEVASAYLSNMLKEGSAQEFMYALGQIAKAYGIAKLAQETGLKRESLYKTLSGATKPRFETILSITRALNMPLKI